MRSLAGNQTLRKLQGFSASCSCSDRVHCGGRKSSVMVRRVLLSLIAAALVAGATATPALAQRGRGGGGGNDSLFSQWDRPREDRQPQREVSLSDVLRDLRSRYGGQHLDARRAGDYYIIAWMTSDGRRLNIRVNAITGREE